jgi:hypothetical protein
VGSQSRPNNYWRQQQHALADGIYLVSDGGGVPNPNPNPNPTLTLTLPLTLTLTLTQVSRGPVERLVATMMLTPQAVAVHCVALRPSVRGRELLQFVAGMTGGTYVECAACDAAPPAPATPYGLLRAVSMWRGERLVVRERGRPCERGRGENSSGLRSRFSLAAPR